MHVVLRFLGTIPALLAVIGCCKYESERINTPGGVTIVETAVGAEFYEPSLYDELLSQSVRDLPSCGEFDRLTAGTTIDVDYYGGGSEWGECGGVSYGALWSGDDGRTYWEGLREAGGYGASRDEVCPPLSREYRCMPFEYSSYYVPSEFQDYELNSWLEQEPNQRHTIQLNVYSRYKFADSDGYGDDFREHPDAFEKGEGGGAPVAIIVRTFETTDPDAFDLPWRLRPDEEGVYRCGDVYYGHFSR